jgi:RNA polymerase sigma-70 factor (ECF subfamily)
MVAPDDDKSMSRARLMARALNGDREAFPALFREIGPVLTRFLRRRVPDQDEIEDVCQEVLLAVYKSRHTYQPERPFEPWLFAIAWKVSGEHFRRGQRRSALQVLSEQITDVGAASWAELAAELREALRELSPNQLEALNFTKVLGMSVAEASERAGTSVGSMKVRMHRA